MSPRFAPLLVLFAFVIAIGCSSGPPQLAQATVKGTVKLDGKPMESGDVMFALPGEPPDTIKVNNGAFEGKAKIGKARIEIRSYKEGKETKMGDTIIPASPENFIPAKWNTESTRIEEVKKDGPNEFNFEVTSK
jgi:hypothetical protein